MSNDELSEIIITGEDPRGLPEFSAIREEINKASHASQPVMDWKLVESLALTIFKKSGVDLHSATYYTLARTRLHGLAGFCEGTELLAALISREWEKFWPLNPQARTEMLDWFNARTSTILRQQITFSTADLPLLYRAERALQVICDTLQQQAELKRLPRVENLLWFMQNSRKQQEVNRSGNAAAQPTVRTLIYTPDTTQTLTLDATLSPLPEIPEQPEIRVAVHNNTDMNALPTKTSGFQLCGFIAGIVLTGLIATLLWWWQVRPLQQQMAQVRDTAQGAAVIWLASPQLTDYEQRLKSLLSISPLHPLETGARMTLVADSQWPESLQQQQATTLWNSALKAHADGSPKMKGWEQTRQDLRTFAELLVKREQNKEGFTLSYIKTVIYQAERTLNQDVPVEYLLTQYENAKIQGQDTSVQEKKIRERMDGILSRWLLLKESSKSETGNNHH
ncbi:VasL domain-containing protein [Enterobacter bugandensis]|uniref:VasL domain-containing protein n=1 Tax=Enterobacter bugandensis TaxID=881260 RepID=UPI0026650E7F|nr:VasL domain-containing protein [Enterobacter bugandensis]MDO2431727.1 VasL domain-containing protein [Enterobacter bugandensis]MDO2444813.1 VasL domain-containing protein [Enterobacter bugandensis]